MGHCLYVNERWCAIAGLAPEEAMGHGWVHGLHPEDRDRISDEWYRAIRDQKPVGSEYITGLCPQRH